MTPDANQPPPDAELSREQVVAAAILDTCVNVDFAPMDEDAAMESLIGGGLDLEATLDMDKAVALIEAYGDDREDHGFEHGVSQTQEAAGL